MSLCSTFFCIWFPKHLGPYSRWKLTLLSAFIFLNFSSFGYKLFTVCNDHIRWESKWMSIIKSPEKNRFLPLVRRGVKGQIPVLRERIMSQALQKRFHSLWIFANNRISNYGRCCLFFFWWEVTTAVVPKLAGSPFKHVKVTSVYV